jgi:hypothetical protein
MLSEKKISEMKAQMFIQEKENLYQFLNVFNISSAKYSCSLDLFSIIAGKQCTGEVKKDNLFSFSEYLLNSPFSNESPFFPLRFYSSPRYFFYLFILFLLFIFRYK